MRAFLYERAYRCKSPAYGDATAVPIQGYNHRAAYTDMPNMCPFVEATTRTIDPEKFDQTRMEWGEGSYTPSLESYVLHYVFS